MVEIERRVKVILITTGRSSILENVSIEDLTEENFDFNNRLSLDKENVEELEEIVYEEFLVSKISKLSQQA